jgi:Zn ribbon nucleic-acid-binding protein
MSAPGYEIEWDGEDGAECPECGALCRTGKMWYTNEEYTSLIDCTECSYIIETESNLAYQNRIKRTTLRGDSR